MTRLIKILLALCLLPLSISWGQTTTITATVIDSDGIAWANAPYTLSFRVNPSQPNQNVYNINGVLLNPALLQYSGYTNGSGVLSQAVYQNTAISPSGSQWTLQICPLSSAGTCGAANFSASGSTMDVSTAINAAITAPRFPALAGSYGYTDLEAQITLPTGATYWNTTLQSQRYWNGSTWINGNLPPGVSCTGSGTSQICTFPGTVAATTMKLGNTTALGAGGVTEINNAVAAFGTAYGQVIASPGMAVGVPSILPNNVALFDYRGTQDILNNVTGTQPGNRLPIQQITQNLADFSYVVLAGTVTMTNGSTAVTGTGTTFLTDIDPGRYFGPSIRMSISTSLQWAEVCAVADDTHATLCFNYAGTTATGTAWNLITQMGPTIRATLTAGTPNTLRAGEWVGYSIFGTRTGGERGLYGMNINLNYLTPVQANQGQVQGLEIDYTNSSGVDDPANNGIGLDILSPGGNYGWVGAWIQGKWENGLILQGFRDRGAYLLGSQNHVIMVDTACTGVACASDNNVNIEETDNAGTPLWYILNKGFGYFLRGMQLNADLTFPIASTGIAGPTAAQGIHDDAALGGWNFSTGASATYGYRFWKGAPGGTLLAVLKPSGEFDATSFAGNGTGLTGTALSLTSGNTNSLTSAATSGTYPSAATATPVLLFTLASGTNATYIVHCNTLGDDATYGASGIVATSGSALLTQLAHGANMTMTLTGFGVYCAQNSGGPTTITWSYVRIM